jgi:alpha-L-rhamnosidase
MDDKESPADEHIRVVDCTFERGAGVVTVGSEATVVRDVTVEQCRCTGPVDLVRLKLRPDTPQDYEDLHYRDITLDATGGNLLRIDPWKQYFDLKGQPPPKSTVRNVTLSNVKGKYGSFGVLEGNPDTTIENITIENVDVTLSKAALQTNHPESITLKNVIVNGKPYSLEK